MLTQTAKLNSVQLNPPFLCFETPPLLSPAEKKINGASIDINVWHYASK